MGDLFASFGQNVLGTGVPGAAGPSSDASNGPFHDGGSGGIDLAENASQSSLLIGGAILAILILEKGK